jgi:hypothetical protein
LLVANDITGSITSSWLAPLCGHFAQRRTA